MTDPFELQRFVDAQHRAYARAVKKLSRGRTAITKLARIR
jgi:uncharacterized protein (DUF1810 family)